MTRAGGGQDRPRRDGVGRARPGFGTVGLDRVGLVPAALAAAAFAWPFVTFKPNRIAAGRGVAFWAALPPAAAWGGGALLLGLALIGVLRLPPALRLAAALAALALLALLVGLAPAVVVPPRQNFARVSFAAGFWLLVAAYGTMAADGAARLGLRPAPRVALLAGVLGVLAGLLGSGWWDGLSLLKEYAAHRDSFWAEALQHVLLAFGSLLAACAVGLPLGVACARAPRLRAATLPVLNIVQTVPSIAMYGLMMVPLGLLAAAVPALGALGIRGIGAAPAALALFLYALLPVVANTGPRARRRVARGRRGGARHGHGQRPAAALDRAAAGRAGGAHRPAHRAGAEHRSRHGGGADRGRGLRGPSSSRAPARPPSTSCCSAPSRPSSWPSRPPVLLDAAADALRRVPA